MSGGIETLHLIGSKALGGAERWFLRYVQALSERGVATRAGIRRDSALTGLDPGAVPVHRLGFRTVWDPLSRREIQRLIERLRPDIVQTYMGRATRLTHLPAGRAPLHIARLGGYYKLNGYRHAHAWIANTKGLRDWLVQSGLPARRVFHIYNFVDPTPAIDSHRIAALRQSLGLPADAWILMTPARFVPVKGHVHLLEALARLPGEIAGRPLRLILLGDGPLRMDLERQARQSGIAGRVIWAGWQTEPAPWFQLADLIVFPSLEQETLGNVILEAWAWRKPLVTTLFRGAREITRHGDDAWCVPCGDATALARGIRELLEQPDLAAALAVGGYRRVTADFARETVMDRYIELYRRLCQR